MEKYIGFTLSEAKTDFKHKLKAKTQVKRLSVSYLSLN